MAHIDLIHLPLISLAAILAMLFVAGTTKGLIGIGMPIVAVPLLNVVVDLPTTVALLSIPLILSNIPQALQGERVGIVVRRLSPILLGLTFGVVIGVHLLTTLSPSSLKPIVGAALVGIVILMLLTPHFAIPKRVEPVAGPVVGLVGGILGGLAALPGPFVFVYILALGVTRDQFVQYSSMFLAIAATLVTLALGGMGGLSWTDAAISTLATAPILLGMWLGTYVRKLVSPELFRKLILGVVAISGVHLIATAVH
jgi:uncharacterized membrane protein YfcA